MLLPPVLHFMFPFAVHDQASYAAWSARPVCCLGCAAPRMVEPILGSLWDTTAANGILQDSTHRNPHNYPLNNMVVPCIRVLRRCLGSPQKKAQALNRAPFQLHVVHVHFMKITHTSWLFVCSCESDKHEEILLSVSKSDKKGHGIRKPISIR